MRCKNKKNAFTLTELLVVVVIIGTLAVVILPKYNKVMETRKTTEAEEVMGAVRTEQEARCALDKPYIGNISKLSHIIPQETTSNFSYQLESTGMLASSQGKYTYNLKMLSYADGRICCDGDDCDKLNKNYLTCSELQSKPDYQEATECSATEPAASCTDTPHTSEPCSTGCGIRTRDHHCVNGEWKYGEWSECEPKPDEEQTCHGCGTQTRTVTCTPGGSWDTSDWGACSKTEEECTPQCGDKPCTCSEWAAYWPTHNYGQTLNEACNDELRVANLSGSTKYTTESDALQQGHCCKDSDYKSVKKMLVELDYTKVYGPKEYYLADGYGEGIDDNTQSQDCLSTGHGCYTTSTACGIGPFNFTNVEAANVEYLEKSSYSEDPCRYCDGTSSCLNKYYKAGSQSTAITDGYAVSPKIDETNYGKTGTGFYCKEMYGACEGESWGAGDKGHDSDGEWHYYPSSYSGDVEGVKEYLGSGEFCENSAGEWMRRVTGMSVTCLPIGDTPAGQQPCTAPVAVYYRPKISVMDVIKCVHK